MSRLETYLTIIAFILLASACFRLIQLVVLKVEASKLKRTIEELELKTAEQVRKQAEIDRLIAEDLARIAGQRGIEI